MYHNETNLTFPTASMEVYSARAIILGEDFGSLSKYLDLPWCRADEYYAQKLALALKDLAGVAWT